jgi:hypothetical protein
MRWCECGLTGKRGAAVPAVATSVVWVVAVRACTPHCLQISGLSRRTRSTSSLSPTGSAGHNGHRSGHRTRRPGQDPPTRYQALQGAPELPAYRRPARCGRNRHDAPLMDPKNPNLHVFSDEQFWLGRNTFKRQRKQCRSLECVTCKFGLPRCIRSIVLAEHHGAHTCSPGDLPPRWLVIAPRCTHA